MTDPPPVKRFRIDPGERVRLDRWDPDSTQGFDGNEADAAAKLKDLKSELERLQELLYAEHRHGVLIVLQGMDTSGKDGTIRRVFDGVNPQGVQVARFRQPTAPEADHDFLRRAHEATPAKGEIVIFNRSHYEDVLIVRVHKLVPKKTIKQRFREINEFERTLSQEGTVLLKFYLHLGFDEQGRRLRARLDDPSKHWKFSVSDLQERPLWPEYIAAYEDVLEKTSTDWAPWYLVPSDHKWFRDLLVCQVLVNTLSKLHMRLPPLSPDATSYLKKESWARKRLEKGR
jgi:PPK2 family polyphosphate:nucleotide phosphotransferase